MRRHSMIRRIVVALASDTIAIGLRLPGGVWVGLVVAVPLAVGTVVVAGMVARVRREVFDGR